MRPTVSAHDGRAEQDQEGKHRGVGHTRGANQSIPPMHGPESAFHDHSRDLAPAGGGGPEPGMTKQARESLDHIRLNVRWLVLRGIERVHLPQQHRPGWGRCNRGVPGVGASMQLMAPDKSSIGPRQRSGLQSSERGGQVCLVEDHTIGVEPLPEHGFRLAHEPVALEATAPVKALIVALASSTSASSVTSSAGVVAGSTGSTSSVL